MSNVNDFKIQNGVLVHYNGSDEDVVIPDGVVGIGGEFLTGAFWGCKNLRSVTIPDSVTFIYQHAFAECENLTSITIPDSVTAIGQFAFSNCTNLKHIELSAGMEYIPWGFCSKCSSLESFAVPEGVTSIGWSAFEECKSLKSIVIPDSVVYIGKGAHGSRPYDKDAYIFHKDTLVIFNNYRKDIEKNNVSARMVFKNTPVQEIKSTNAKRYAVHGFLTIEDLSVYGAGVVDSYQKLLKGKVFNYINFILENDVEMIVKRLAALDLIDNKFVEKMLEKDLPEGVKGILSEYADKSLENKEGVSEKKPLSVTALKKIWGFQKNEEGITITSYKGVDTEVIIPEKIGKDPVTEIGEYAFASFKSGLSKQLIETRSKITSVKIPNSVTRIGTFAFLRCSSLKSITIPDSVKTIGEKAFSQCRSLTEVVIPDSVTRIGNSLFYMSDNLNSIYFANDFASYLDFNYKDLLQGIYKGYNLYINGELVTNITIPDATTKIDDFLFKGCSSLKSIMIPDSVTRIGERAFYECSGLKNVIISDSVTSIEDWAFSHCSSLESITIPDSVTSIGKGAFYECSGLKSVTIPNSDTVINDLAFDRCTSLTIFAPTGSLAQQYANEKTVTFKPISR